MIFPEALMGQDLIFKFQTLFTGIGPRFLFFLGWGTGLLIFPSFVFSQTVTQAASLAAPLENLEGSARDLALGSAFVGVADDSSAIYFNPAGLSNLQNPEIALHHNSYLAGTFQETLEAGFPAGDMGGLAFSLDYVGWGTLDLRNAYGASEGSFNDSDVGFTAGWGREWLPGFSAGLALRGLQQKVVNDLYASLAGDIGVLWVPVKNLRLAMSYLNLGTPVAGNQLSGDWKAGGSCLIRFDSRFTLLTALSGDWTPGGVGSAQAGLEGTLNKQWTLRVGYQLPFYDNQIDGLTGLTAGAGIKISSLTLDYAYLPFGTLGDSNRISLTYQFDLPKQVVKEVVQVNVPVQMPVTVIQMVPQPPDAKDVEVHFKISTDPLAQGQAFEKEGKWKEAIELYVEALKEKPDDDLLWKALANGYYHLGKRDYAIQSFEKVIQLEPDNQTLKDWLIQYKNSVNSN
jgi:hypothetical protein